MKQVSQMLSFPILLVILCVVSGEKIRGGTNTSAGDRGSHNTRDQEGQAEQSSSYTRVLVMFSVFVFMVIAVYVYASFWDDFKKSASDGDTICSQNEEPESCEDEGNEPNSMTQEEA